ncbi:MAG TPA: hypothetical protein DCG19_09245 [Cryomorphaceae bacterium]|nr:hypothetical protein [Owenweeksia sp.]MBF97915.1 hypothetical protein [Owenweeksia sp.]HAD97580.1 hypothetical protein [Cryomorphaceae bacterium]HCQ15931.1 hypothetical protein [Cryomorphaceae bacterium]|tara:strand:+ start:12694 stop:14856 length:2163 start_codon:yes stop_codon:yes gene_type:complete
MKKKKVFLKLFLLLTLVSGSLSTTYGQLIVGPQKKSNIGKNLMLLNDSSCSGLQQIISAQFTPEEDNVPLYEGSEGCRWFRLPLVNHSGEDQLVLEIYNPTIDFVELHYRGPNGEWIVKRQGRSIPTPHWDFKLPNLLFELDIEDSASQDIYLRVQNPEQFSLPVNIGVKDEIMIASFGDQVLFGLYAGIMLALFFYNIFIYFSVRDRSYIFYVAHTLFVLLTQASAFGYAALYLWPNSPWLAERSFVLFTCLVSLAGIRFFFEFLKVRDFLPRFYLFFRGLEFIYLGIILIEILNLRNLAYQILFPLQGLIVISIFTASLMILRRGYQPAKIYVLSWSVLLIGVLIFTLKDFSILPYNYLTVHTIQIGSALEAILLSFALADKINILKREKEESQMESLRVSQENEKIIREQNVVLEQRVLERTMELQEANEELQVTLANLKDTQTQLVDAEKMASLGQLTAGIAHEINNPINFVTSNIAPLRRDLLEIYEIVDTYASVPLDNPREALEKAHELQEDYDFEYLKEEIESLVDGISDGATRTSEIVKGLRTFSRLDEDDIKQISVEEGLNSTLVLLRNKTKDLIDIETDYEPGLPEIECFPGKLNQVFMNILSNGIYAVNAKRYEEGEQPKLTIKTRKTEGSRVSVYLGDNGIGMDEATKKKIFEPFFTTKDVGEGTGLGMSIVFKIIEKHNGTIAVNSEPGKGTEFIITLPMSQPNLSE